MGDTTLTRITRLLDFNDPQLSFKWVCRYLPFDLDPARMENIDLPFNNITIGQGVYSAGSFRYYPGTNDIAAFTASFYEDHYATAHDWIFNWKRKVVDHQTGIYGLPKDYKQTIVVSLLDAQNNMSMTVKLLGVWPADTNPMNLTYTDTSGRIILQQNFSVDDSEIQIHKSGRRY